MKAEDTNCGNSLVDIIEEGESPGLLEQIKIEGKVKDISEVCFKDFIFSVKKKDHWLKLGEL